MITALDQNTALVIIDLQKGITRLEPAPYTCAEVFEKVSQLVKAFRKANLPIVVVNVDPSGSPLRTARVDMPMYPKNSTAPAFNANPDFLEIVTEIGAEPQDIYITKNTWGAFFNTPLHNELKKRNVTGIVLTGIATSIGVEATARSASELGYNISFATDAMSDRVAENHQHSLEKVFPRIGEQGSTQDIINQLAIR